MAPALMTDVAAIFGGLLLSAPLGWYLARVWGSGADDSELPLGPVERAIGRLLAVDPSRGQGPTAYALGLLAFNAFGFLVIYVALRLPTNWMLGSPFSAGLSPDLAFRVALTSLSGCAPATAAPGEPIDLGVDVVSQILGLVFAVTSSLCLTARLARGFAARGGRRTIGNFPTDAIRNLVHVVAPLAALTALLWPLVGALAMVASLPEARVPSPGGAILDPAIVPAVVLNATRYAGAYALGRIVRASADGRLLAILMAVISLPLAWITASYLNAPPRLTSLSLLVTLVRTTLAATLGAGSESIVVMAILASWLGALLIGRNPEYFGKRLNRRAMTLTTVASLALWAALLAFSGVEAYAPSALAALLRAPWPLASPSTAYANAAIGLAQAVGRFGAAVPIIALVAALEQQPRRALTAGTLATDGAGFATLLSLLIMATCVIRGLPWLLSPAEAGGRPLPTARPAIGDLRAGSATSPPPHASPRWPRGT